MKKKLLMSWSSGKDSAWALFRLQQQAEFDIAGLFCTVNKKYQRVAMHAIRLELLKLQASSIGLPLQIIEIPHQCSNTEYQKIMREFVARARNEDVEFIAFGDLYLENVRRYRENNLLNTGITPYFPIWNVPTDTLAREMIDAGVKAVISCVDPKQVSTKLAGNMFDESFLQALPNSADSCGENGEFHSFVFDGPMFNEKIDIVVGDCVRRDDFVFADILPK